ncbi:MAG: phenylalanine--tRNA ligase subunit beta [Pyrobaculum sp.]
MPVFDVAKFDLERLTGLKYEEVAKLLEYVKCEVEEDSGDRVRLEVTHDRPDHFSAEGLARTLKGVAGAEMGLPRIYVSQSTVELRAEHIEERPYISMAVVRDVELDDEAIRQLIQLQEKLHETYGRSRRKVAIGFYDLSKIKPPISYRRVSKDVEYVPLGFSRPIPIKEMYEATEQGRKYSALINRENPPALVDGAGQVMVVIPVLGSECCKVTPHTKDVLIDVTGTDLRAVHNTMSVLIYALLERSRSKIVEVVAGGNSYVHNYIRHRVDIDEVASLIGVQLDADQFKHLLQRARMDYADGEVVAPPYRINLLSWVDVAEDVAVLLGYNQLPREAPRVLSAGRRHRVEVFTEDLRRALLSMGFAEVNNYVLTDRDVSEFCKVAVVKNPISELYAAVRCTLVADLIKAAATLRRREIRLFEVGEVVKEGKTRRAAAFLISREGATLTDGLSVATTICKVHGLSCRVEPLEAPWGLPNRVAGIRGDVEGVVAEVHPDFLAKHGHLTPTVVGEFLVD